jgi:hypothetical protein
MLQFGVWEKQTCSAVDWIIKSKQIRLPRTSAACRGNSALPCFVVQAIDEIMWCNYLEIINNYSSLSNGWFVPVIGHFYFYFIVTTCLFFLVAEHTACNKAKRGDYVLSVDGVRPMPSGKVPVTHAQQVPCSPNKDPILLPEWVILDILGYTRYRQHSNGIECWSPYMMDLADQTSSTILIFEFVVYSRRPNWRQRYISNYNFINIHIKISCWSVYNDLKGRNLDRKHTHQNREWLLLQLDMKTLNNYIEL